VNELVEVAAAAVVVVTVATIKYYALSYVVVIFDLNS